MINTRIEMQPMETSTSVLSLYKTDNIGNMIGFAFIAFVALGVFFFWRRKGAYASPSVYEAVTNPGEPYSDKLFRDDNDDLNEGEENALM